MSVAIPFGLFRADGLDGRPGTPTPDDALIVEPLPTYFEEDVDSPIIELAEQGTVVHTFKCDWNVTAKSILTTPSPYYRGNIFTDPDGNQYKILSVEVQHLRGDATSVKIITEGINFGLPPDEFHVDALEFNPALQKHPRYAGLNKGLVGLLTQDVTAGSTPAARALAVLQIPLVYPNTTPRNFSDLNTASWELVTKLLRGEETFYLAGYRVSWSQYYSLPQPLDPGGRIEDPVDGGLPVQFYSDTGAPGGANIFNLLAADRSPAFYGNGLSWLRQADTLDYQRTWFRITRSWIGGPAGGTGVNGFYYLGQWDRDIYQPGDFTEYGIFERTVDAQWPNDPLLNP